MQVHICTPYSLQKNLGAVYNETMARIPDGDAACLIDYDVQFLHPESGKDLHEYANRNPEAVLTCFTNRVSPLSKQQLFFGVPSEDSDIRNHIKIAEEQRKHLYNTTPIHRDISGMLMVVPKSIWQKYPFDETGKCLGIDTFWGRKVRAAGISILRMDGLFVFHQYRLLQGTSDKSHLKA